MMNRKYLRIYSWVIVLIWILTALLMLFSWVGNLYGLAVQNILSGEGIRWMLTNALKESIQFVPFLSLTCLLMTWGVVLESGWFRALYLFCTGKFRRLSIKQIIAFQISLVVLGLYLALLTLGILSPDAPLLSVNGTLRHSPLSEGFPLLVSYGFTIIGCVYGFFSGSFRNFYQVVSGLIQGFTLGIPILILVFFLVNLVLEFRWIF